MSVDLAKRRRIVFDACVLLLHKAGIITRPLTDIGELLDLAHARGAFVRALGKTSAWPVAVSTVRSSGTLDPWLAHHGLDASWMAEWAARAAPRMAACPDDDVPIDGILFGHSPGPGLLPDCYPKPDTSGLLAALEMIEPGGGEWAIDEPPPMPAIERKDHFLARMAMAWDRRADALGDSSGRKRQIETHAAWCARLVAGETVVPAAPAGTIRKAVQSFSAFIEIRNPQKPAGKTPPL